MHAHEDVDVDVDVDGLSAQPSFHLRLRPYLTHGKCRSGEKPGRVPDDPFLRWRRPSSKPERCSRRAAEAAEEEGAWSSPSHALRLWCARLSLVNLVR